MPPLTNKTSYGNPSASTIIEKPLWLPNEQNPDNYVHAEVLSDLDYETAMEPFFANNPGARALFELYNVEHVMTAEAGGPRDRLRALLEFIAQRNISRNIRVLPDRELSLDERIQVYFEQEPPEFRITPRDLETGSMPIDPLLHDVNLQTGDVINEVYIPYLIQTLGVSYDGPNEYLLQHIAEELWKADRGKQDEVIAQAIQLLESGSSVDEIVINSADIVGADEVSSNIKVDTAGVMMDYRILAIILGIPLDKAQTEAEFISYLQKLLDAVGFVRSLRIFEQQLIISNDTTPVSLLNDSEIEGQGVTVECIPYSLRNALRALKVSEGQIPSPSAIIAQLGLQRAPGGYTMPYENFNPDKPNSIYKFLDQFGLRDAESTDWVENLTAIRRGIGVFWFINNTHSRIITGYRLNRQTRRLELAVVDPLYSERIQWIPYYNLFDEWWEYHKGGFGGGMAHLILRNEYTPSQDSDSRIRILQ